MLFLLGYSLAIHGRTKTNQPLEAIGVTDLTALLHDLEVVFFFALVP